MASGYTVTLVRNITDIDDKIIARAVQNQEPIAQLTQRFIDALHEDSEALGILAPTHEPRATQYVPQMLALVDRLAQKGLAYQEDGSHLSDVLFSTRRFSSYGALSGTDPTQSEDPDFVLWKTAKPHEPQDAQWDSPWGRGRPGWHLECSAMSHALLGEQFDIHGGGADLKFPHHENEIAQSQGAFGKNPATVWMHNGFVTVNHEKMGKSQGNFFTIREVLKTTHPETLRFFLMRSHYRSNMEYSDKELQEAHVGLQTLYQALASVPPNHTVLDWSQPHALAFKSAMNNDFSTPDAVAVLYDLAHEVHRSKDPALASQLQQLGNVLGVFSTSPRAFLQWGVAVEPSWIEALVQERTQAKFEKNYARADAIRQQLQDASILLQDTPEGTLWSMDASFQEHF